MQINIIIFSLVLFISCRSVSDTGTSDQIMILWTETYGSVCCPRDPQHQNHIVDYMVDFEEQHNVKITDTYRIIKGREGEATYYLTLNGLNTKQRKDFIINRYPKYSDEAKEELVKKIQNPIDLKKLIKPWTMEDVEKIN